MGAIGIGALAFAVSCADSRNITGPPATSQAASLVSAHQAPVAGDVVIMHRSTLVAAHDAAGKVNRKFTEKISGQIRVRGKDDSTLPGTARVDFTAGVLPRPVVSLPARTETGMCSALPSWSRVEKIGVGGNATISGVGDAPASHLTIVAADGTVLTVERTWVRTSRTWQLAKQTTTTPDKRFRDEVVYEHQSVSGEPIDHALPTVACGDARGPGLLSDKAYRGFYSPHVSSVASRLFPLSDGATAYTCGDSVNDCFTQENAVYTADVALVAAATIATYACVGAALVLPPACLAAGVAYAVTVANLALAVRALNHCLYTLTLPKTPALRAPEWVPTANPLALGDVTSNASRLPGLQPEVFADCSGGDSGGGTIQCHSEEWEISYDGGATWNYLTTIQVCENVL